MPFVAKNLSSVLLASLVLSFVGGAAMACPELVTCKSDEQMSIERDERGCNLVTCLKAEANQVDEYYQDIPQAPKLQTVENKEAAAPVVTIEPIHPESAPVAVEVPATPVPAAEDSKEKVATENPALAAPVADTPDSHLAAEPESQKIPVVGGATPAGEDAVATKNPGTAEPAAAPEKAPRADAPASPAAKTASPSSAI